VSASEVSAFEPQPLAEPTLDLPEFVVVKRGVDRRQVEEWGSTLTSLIEQERRRADQAEEALYRMQLEAKGSPSFSHLGAHVADIIEEAGRSAEKMLLDAADRAQEVIDEAEVERAEMIAAAQAQTGEIQDAARQDAEQARAEGARVAKETRRTAEAFRAQTEQEARHLLEETREATDQLWKETERECALVDRETRRLEGLRQRTHEQLGRMYGHLESVLEEIRLGIDGAQDIDENGQPKPAEPVTPDEPAAGRRPARAKATRPSMAEAEPATGIRS
jgi:cell division septum initiation protein DivIVA